MKKMPMLFAVPLAIMAVAMFVFSGCEEADNRESLVVDPSFVDLTKVLTTNKNVTLTFAVVEGLKELSLPLEWRVSDTTLGDIVFQSGKTASYVPAIVVGSGGTWTWKTGVNAIMVEDQYGSQGMATVAQ